MNLSTLLILALGLAMDAFAVSVTNGMCCSGRGFKDPFASSLTFGLFQAGMPVIGYYAGTLFNEAVSSFDHWIALGLLAILGGSMLAEGIKELRHPDECDSCCAVLSFKRLMVQGIATSIDALAVGISFAVMNVNLWEAVSAIGVVTFICSLIGYGLGVKFGGKLGQRAKIFGGIMLIGIGLKIFIEHMFF